MHPSLLEPAPAAPRPAAVDARLASLLDDLHRLHLRGQVHTYRNAGEDDVRLQAAAEASPVTVELLWCTPEGEAPSRLAAVRIDDGHRQVWCTHEGRWAPEQAVRFVYDLLVCDEQVLEGHYQRLG